MKISSAVTITSVAVTQLVPAADGVDEQRIPVLFSIRVCHLKGPEVQTHLVICCLRWSKTTKKKKEKNWEIISKKRGKAKF